MHLRWELYPVPHEKGRAHYGGSYFEEPNWWTKPAQRSFLGEAKEMAKEIFGIKTLFRNNRSLWYFSYPFHIGLYLLTVFAVLIFIGGSAQAVGIVVSPVSYGWVGRVIYSLTLYSGVAGYVLGGVGALGLLVMRILRASLRSFSLRSDYFNLVLLIVIFIVSLIAWYYTDRSFAVLRYFVQKTILLKPTAGLPGLVMAQITTTAFFFAYLPFTHMTHFVGKFFTFHKVRWQDQANIGSGVLADSVARALSGQLHWSAPHIESGATWAKNADEKGKNAGGAAD